MSNPTIASLDSAISALDKVLEEMRKTDPRAVAAAEALVASGLPDGQVEAAVRDPASEYGVSYIVHGEPEEKCHCVGDCVC